MSKNKLFCILRISTKTHCFSGSYNDCMEFFNSKDKEFRKINKIAPITESRGYKTF